MAKFTVMGIDIHVEERNNNGEQTLVLLHGFTGSTKTWHPVIDHLPRNYRIITVDLIGHGQTAAPDDIEFYAMKTQVALLEQLFRQLRLKRFTLLGYSMGGRVALSYAIRYPEHINQLILESASPGLAAPEERSMRKVADDTLADKIITNGVFSFVKKWESIPLFATQKQLPDAVQQEIRKERLSQRAIGLANSLRGMGTGVMPSLWQQLHQLKIPVLLITGSEDSKFELLAQKMIQHLSKSSHISVNGVGHAIHVENPAQFATIVKEAFIQEIRGK